MRSGIVWIARKLDQRIADKKSEDDMEGEKEEKRIEIIAPCKIDWRK